MIQFVLEVLPRLCLRGSNLDIIAPQILLNGVVTFRSHDDPISLLWSFSLFSSWFFSLQSPLAARLCKDPKQRKERSREKNKVDAWKILWETHQVEYVSGRRRRNRSLVVAKSLTNSQTLKRNPSNRKFCVLLTPLFCWIAFVSVSASRSFAHRQIVTLLLSLCLSFFLRNRQILKLGILLQKS